MRTIVAIVMGSIFATSIMIMDNRKEEARKAQIEEHMQQAVDAVRRQYGVRAHLADGVPYTRCPPNPACPDESGFNNSLYWMPPMNNYYINQLR